MATLYTNKSATASGGVTDAGVSVSTLDGYFKLAGRPGGQIANGGTAASENLTLRSTANATKGSIVLGSTTFNEVTGRWGFGVASDANYTAVFGGLAANDGIKVENSNRSYFDFFGGAGGRVQINGFNGSATRLGQTPATGFVSFECQAGETILFGLDHAGSIKFITNNGERLMIDSGGMTLPGGGNIALSTTTGTKIATGPTQLLGFYNATPVDQPATVADPSGGATIDAEARTAIIAVIDRLQELGLVA